MRLLMWITASLLLSACASTYEAPRTQSPTVSAATAASKSEVISTARKVLVAEGFQILSADEASGTLSTTMRNFRLSPEQADCGTTMGLDYLKDKRTATRLAYNILVDDGRLTVKALIEGEYKPGAVDQDITLTCISRGSLDREMLAKITAALPK